jgi:hypothetical protein
MKALAPAAEVFRISGPMYFADDDIGDSLIVLLARTTVMMSLSRVLKAKIPAITDPRLPRLLPRLLLRFRTRKSLTLMIHTTTQASGTLQNQRKKKHPRSLHPDVAASGVEIPEANAANTENDGTLTSSLCSNQCFRIRNFMSITQLLSTENQH